MRSGVPGTLTRSLLLVILAMAVTGMHHLLGVAPGDAHHPAAARHTTVTEESGAARPAVLRDGEGVSCCPGVHPVAGERDDPAGGHSGHDLLHLCLAILAVAVGVALTLFVLGGRPPAAAPESGAVRGPAPFARPPPPAHSRRLAVLGVLRL